MNNSNNDNQRDPNYWKSLSELHNSPESMEVKANEFMQGVTDDFDISKLSPLSRRKFLALLSASAAFAAAGCGKDKGEIIPYNKKPEEIIVGKANFYASTCTGCPNACGIVVKTREGRPIKIDGNPDHPVNLGKICAIGQASVLNLYDPGRLKMPLISNGGAHTSTTWQKADDEIIAALASASGKEIALITHKIVSPSAKKVIDGFGAKYPGLKVYSYELFDDNNRNEAWRKSYGSGSCPPVKWEDAKIIVALESDFLANEGHTIENVRRYSATRNAIDKKEFSRLYSVEGAMSVTGMNADYRLRLRPDAQFQFVTALINEIQQKAPAAGSSSLKDFAAKHKMSLKSINRLLTDLNSNRGSAIVYAGDNLPVEVHLAVNQLNEVLGNNKLYDSSQMPVTYVEPAGKEQWGSLIQNMNGGNVAAVIHFDTNPVYHLPADSGYRDDLKFVKLSVAMTEQENETSALCRYVLPVHHALESWGDFNIRGNIYSLQQPVISPLYNSRQKEAVLVVWTSGSRDTYKENLYHDFIASNWEKDVFPILNLPLTFKEFWLSALERGVVEGTNSTVLTPVFRPESMSGLNSQQAGTGYLVYLKNNYSIGDGRYANNGWLQELPHPVSKIVWDNYAAISPATARELKLENNDKIEVKSGSRKVELPVFIQPGMADKVIVIELGYGRSRAGEVGTGVGVNANLLMTAAISGSRFILPDITIAKQPGSYELVSTQEQHSLDDAFLKDIHKQRGIIREGTVEEYKNNPDFLEKDKREQPSLNKEVQYKGVKWGMGIDLNKCIGCNACIIACDIENNIPVVGKEQVSHGRHMHWFRVDRYYSGTPDEPEVYNQPMLCQHCDTAPCENVCPVAATTHSPDGLNQMAYNRCVGTRYCSNNCPYKVRRFNFFNFRDHFADGYYEQEPAELVRNPEVTVRTRGVMEKCTFCIQRIMEAREIAIEENREIKGTDVQTACQQACPAQAIVFGDVNDPESEVSRYRNHQLGYHVLAELNTRPNVTYIAKLKNTTSEEK